MADKTTGKDETFSMEDLEKGLKRARGPRRLLWLGGGVVLGVAAALLVPRYVGPYLPGLLPGSGETLTGPVLAKEREGDRLLLTLDTQRGALIASFTERVSEIGLLVATGDTVAIRVSDYEPFVENPDVEGVRKARPPAGEAGQAGTAPGRPPGPGEAGSTGGPSPVSPPGAARAGADTLPSDTLGSDTPGEGAAAPDSAGAAGARR